MQSPNATNLFNAVTTVRESKILSSFELLLILAAEEQLLSLDIKWTWRSMNSGWSVRVGRGNVIGFISLG